MANAKKKGEEPKPKPEPRRQRVPRPVRRSTTETSFVKLDIEREIRYITKRAQAEDSRVVTLGNLVLFSTRTRDAWLLDAEDNFAMCLCREGKPQPFRIIDGPETFAIEWTADFVIEGEAFIVRERTGRVVKIHGYPTVEICAACRGYRQGTDS
jgi:hypothetical protein